MECVPTDSTSFPEPEHIGVRVEILPDLYVEVETARRIHALLFVLATLIVVCAFGPRTALRQALTHRPLFPALPETSPPPASYSGAPARPASELRFLEGFMRARKRALEVLQYAITTAPPALRTQRVDLAGDPAAPLDPSRFRLKIRCAPADPTVTRGVIENLRALLPGTAVAAPDDADEGSITIDSAAEPPPAPGPLAATEPLAHASAEAAANAPAEPAPSAPPEPAAPASALVGPAEDIEPLAPVTGRLAAIPPPIAAPPPARTPSALLSSAPTNGLLAAARAMDPVLSRAPLLPVRGTSAARAAASAPRASTFPRASAIPAPESGRLIPLFGAVAPAPLASARALPPAPAGDDDEEDPSEGGSE